MSENIVVRSAEDVCCPYCVKLFPLVDGLLRLPLQVPGEGRSGLPTGHQGGESESAKYNGEGG